jgi:hypothetical protein
MYPNGTIIMEVKRALYSLVESAMLWYKELSSTLIADGFENIKSDKGVFRKKVGAEDIIICIHVDDIFTSSTSIKLEESLWNLLRSKYDGIKVQKGNELNYLSYNIKYDQENGIIKLSKENYLKSLIKEHNITIGSTTPTDNNFLSVNDKNELIDVTTFKSKLMQVAYLRDVFPEIDFAISFLNTRANKPNKSDEVKLTHVLQYLFNNQDGCLTFKPSTLNIYAYCDASYAIHPDARSHYGNIIMLGKGNSPIHNKSGVIHSVVRSSTEAEISALNEVTSDLLWTIDILKELQLYDGLTRIFEDNQASISLINKEPRNYQTRSKHIRVKYEFLREQVINNTIVPIVLLVICWLIYLQSQSLELAFVA